MRRSHKIISALAVIAATVALLYWTDLARILQPDAGSNARSFATIHTHDPVMLSEGRALYLTECASCHGKDLEGEPNWRQRRADGTLPAPPHDESGHTWHHPDALLFQMTKAGTAALAGSGYKSNMPAFADRLSDTQIRAVLAYIKSTWPDRAREHQAAIDQAYRQRH